MLIISGIIFVLCILVPNLYGRAKTIDMGIRKTRELIDELGKRISRLEDKLGLGESKVSPDHAAARMERKDIRITAAEEPEEQPLVKVPPPVPVPAATPAQIDLKLSSIPQAPPPPPRPPRENIVFKYIKEFFTTGNMVVKVGVIILFFGLTFLIKFAADQGYFPVELRVIGIALLGIILTVFGWRLRHKKTGYALVLQGAGIAIFYLDTFAAYRLFALIPSVAATVFLVVTVICSVVLAVGQDAKILAIMGLSGGFLAPVLTSTGSGNYIALFSFYAILNAGIFAIAWFKAWRFLNLLGFFFTFGIGSIWGLKYYKPEFFATTEPFLVLFFLYYTFNAVLFAFKQKPQLRGFVDGSLVFGTPLVVFSLQYGLVGDFTYGLAWSALALGLFYLSLATVLMKKSDEKFRDLVESFLAVGVGFATLTIPLALNAQWTSALWAMEGAGLVWIGVRQQRVLSRAFGCLLVITSGYTFFDMIELQSLPEVVRFPVFNGTFFGCLVKGAAALFAAHTLQYFRERLKKFEFFYSAWLLMFGLFWWYYGGATELKDQILPDYLNLACALFFAVSLVLSELVGKKLDWMLLRQASPVFAAVSVPFMMTEYWVSLSWSLIGVWRVATAVQDKKITGKAFGAVLLLMAGFIYYPYTLSVYFSDATHFAEKFAPTLPLVNIYFLSGLISSLSALAAAFLIHRQDKEKPFDLGFLLLMWGLMQWFFMGITELYIHGPEQQFFYLSIIFSTLSLTIVEYLRRRLNWSLLHLPNMFFVPVIYLLLMVIIDGQSHPFQNLGFLAWPLVYAQIYWFLRRYDSDTTQRPATKYALPAGFHHFLHAAALWHLIVIVTWEVSWQVETRIPETITWAAVMRCLIPTVFLFAVATQHQRIKWPVLPHLRTYLLWAMIPLVIYGLGWNLLTNFSNPGDVAPLPYLPLLNPVDLTMGFVFLATIFWLFSLRKNGLLGLAGPQMRNAGFALAILIFIWINGILIRSIHQWAGVPFAFDALYDSLLVQMSVSIYWCLIGMCVMIMATRYKWRITWIAGAVLLGVVVLKLIFVDYLNRGTLQQTISTIVVGLLFVITGYFSPLPPAGQKERT